LILCNKKCIIANITSINVFIMSDTDKIYEAGPDLDLVTGDFKPEDDGSHSLQIIAGLGIASEMEAIKEATNEAVAASGALAVGTCYNGTISDIRIYKQVAKRERRDLGPEPDFPPRVWISDNHLVLANGERFNIEPIPEQERVVIEYAAAHPGKPVQRADIKGLETLSLVAVKRWCMRSEFADRVTFEQSNRYSSMTWTREQETREPDVPVELPKAWISYGKLVTAEGHVYSLVEFPKNYRPVIEYIAARPSELISSKTIAELHDAYNKSTNESFLRNLKMRIAASGIAELGLWRIPGDIKDYFAWGTPDHPDVSPAVVIRKPNGVK
jgi:hypothetical protein